MIDLSIVIPGIRPHRWIEVYRTALQSCTKYSFEIVFVGPYDPPDELKDNPQIKYIKDWGTPTRCSQIGSLNSSGNLLMRSDDDSVFFPEALDKAITMFEHASSNDMIALRYREGINFTGQELPNIYWFAHTHFPKQKDMKVLKKSNKYIFGKMFAFEELHIPDNYLVCMIPLMATKSFIDLGGYDCRFEHLSFAAHDLCYRVQRNGGVIHLSPSEVTNIEHQPAGTPEHVPIEQSHFETDQPLFCQIYKDSNVMNRIKINIDNWKDSPEVWSRRFPQGKTA